MIDNAFGLTPDHPQPLSLGLLENQLGQENLLELRAKRQQRKIKIHVIKNINNSEYASRYHLPSV